jgi:hypothetical protein
VINSFAAIETILTSRGRRPCAVTADINIFAHLILQVVCSILLARGVRNTGLVSVLIDTSGVSTIA